MIVVWEADGRPAAGGYGTEVVRRLRRAGFEPVLVPLTEAPPDDRHLSARMHVITGGDTPVDTQVRWLDEAKARLQWVLERAMAGEASVTGICFGAQLIAELLAGPEAVDDHPRGMQAGLVRLNSGAAVSSFHFKRVCPDVIEDAGAVITAASKATDVEAFRFGQNIRGVQFHPELDPSQLHRRLCCYGDVVEAHGLLLSAALRTVELREPRWTDRHWVDLVERPAAEALRRAA